MNNCPYATREDIVTVEQLAPMLGMEQDTIREWAKKGLIGHYWKGRRYLFSLSRHVRPFLEQDEFIPAFQKDIAKKGATND